MTLTKNGDTRVLTDEKMIIEFKKNGWTEVIVEKKKTASDKKPVE